MAGFQQAANAITGSFGTVAGKVGLYSELVGKNQKLIGELKTANKSLEESNEKMTGLNEELDKKNEQLQDFYDILKQEQAWGLRMGKEAEEEYNKKVMETQKKRKKTNELKKVIERRASIIDREWERNASHMSKNMMINALYGDLSSGSGGGI